MNTEDIKSFTVDAVNGPQSCNSTCIVSFECMPYYHGLLCLSLPFSGKLCGNRDSHQTHVALGNLPCISALKNALADVECRRLQGEEGTRNVRDYARRRQTRKATGGGTP